MGPLAVELQPLQSLVDLILADRLSLIYLVLRFSWNWVLGVAETEVGCWLSYAVGHVDHLLGQKCE